MRKITLGNVEKKLLKRLETSSSGVYFFNIASSFASVCEEGPRPVFKQPAERGSKLGKALKGDPGERKIR